MEIGETVVFEASMGLQNLQHEPNRLLSEAERLNAELESLVMDNYRIFVENLTCSVHLRTEDKKLGECAGELGNKLSGLQQQCATFRDRVNQFVNAHKRNRKTLQHHMQLVELLEVPQLVDACARNGFHEEALELANFVNGLERRHLLAAEVRSVDGKARGGSGVVQSIVDDVHTTLVSLRQQLLHLLTEQASLPKELQILATLRKLDGLLIDRQLALERHDNEILAQMTDKQREKLRQHLLQCAETRLQMDFLEARTVWLERVADRALHGLGSGNGVEGGGAASMLAGLALASDGNGDDKPTTLNASSSSSSSSSASASSSSSSGAATASLGPYGRALEMLEVNRTTWFSVVTQFKALFEENKQQGTTTNSGSSSSNASDGQQIAGHTEEYLGSHPPIAILSAWATRQVHQLLSNLKQLLPSIEEGASLRAVLEQTCFFASRMGQVGCDFSGLALPMFRQTLVVRLVADWRVAVAHFKAMISTERFVVEVDEVAKEQMIPLYLRQDQVGAGDDAVLTGAAGGASGGTSTTMSRGRANDDVVAPAAAMTYPPLAYLLNALLTGLNFLRECPLLSAKEALHGELVSVMRDCCSFLVGIAGDLRMRGSKYLPQSNVAVKNKGKGASDDTMSAAAAATSSLPMDKQYALVYVQEVIPHVLVCFEHVYTTDPTATTTAAPSRLGGARKAASASVGLKVESLLAAKDSLTAESYAALWVCWSMLRKAELLPAERVALPPTVSSQSSSLPPTRPQVTTGSAAGGSSATASATATTTTTVSPTNAAKPPPAPPGEEELETNNNSTLNSKANQPTPAVAAKEEGDEWVDDF